MKILLMAPESALIEPTQILMATAESLLDAGFDIDIILCDGRLASTCNYVLNRDRAVKQSRKSIFCLECKYISNRVWSQFQDYKRVSILSFGEGVQNKEPSPLLLSGSTDWDNFSYKNLPIGRYAQYIDILEFGALPPKSYLFDNIGKLEDLMHLVDFLETRLSEMQYQLGIVSNIYYPHHRVFFELLTRMGVEVLNVSRSPIRSKNVMRFEHSKDRFAFQRAIKSESDWGHLGTRCTERELEILREHFAETFRGNSPRTYSKQIGQHSSEEIKILLGIEKTDNRELVLALGSSDDEDLALRHTLALFSRNGERIRTQNEFIESIFAIASENEDYIFVYRPHPRMFSNHKYERKSPILNEQLTYIYKNKPQNLVIDLPSLEISVWDYVKNVAAVINHRSSVGIEFLLAGVPVILYDENSLNAYPSELNTFVFKYQTFSKLNTLKLREIDLVARVMTLRYCAYKYIKSTIPYFVDKVSSSKNMVNSLEGEKFNLLVYGKNRLRSLKEFCYPRIPFFRRKGMGYAIKLLGEDSRPQIYATDKSAFLELVGLKSEAGGKGEPLLSSFVDSPSKEEERFLADFRKHLCVGRERISRL